MATLGVAPLGIVFLAKRPALKPHQTRKTPPHESLVVGENREERWWTCVFV